MVQTIQHSHTKPLTQPALSVIGIETQEQLLAEGAFLDILVEANRQSLQPAYRGDTLPMPTIPLGTLALFFNGEECTHAGIVNLSIEKPGLRDFSVATWPLTSAVSLPQGYFDCSDKRGSLIVKQCVRYQGSVRDEQGEFACTVTRLPHALAVDLRARIGLEAHERLQTIYWNEDELERLRREREEFERFANALQQELETINAQ